MSSIAYVTDEDMLEYVRLCARRTMLFWRHSGRRIADFYKGDLLFFFARPKVGRKKALIGYAHYDSTKRLSLNQIWKQYGDACGYSSREKLNDAVRKASRGELPKQMQCLYLTDVVFFSVPVYPEDAGITIPQNLESYLYLDKDDPSVTLRILKAAERHGVDIWSQDRTRNPEEIFENDEVRHVLAVIHKKIGEEAGSSGEKREMRRLASEKLKQSRWEIIRGSRFDCVHMTEKQIHICIPFVTQQNDKQLRIREYIGRMTMYRYYIKQYQINRRIYFQLSGEDIPADVQKLLEQINHE